MANLPPYTDLLKRHEGQTAIICGAGPSLELEFNQHHRREAIHAHTVFAVNSAIMNVDWDEGSPERRYWISNDALCRRWGYWKNVMRSRATRIVRDSWEKYYDEIPDFYYFWRRPTAEGIVNSEDDGLAYCSSVPSSLDFAIQSGHKRIILLGVDHRMTDGKSHFYQFWPISKWPKGWQMLLASQSQQKSVFVDYNALAFSALKIFADEKGVEVFNANPMSKVEAFPKITLDEALEMIG